MYVESYPQAYIEYLVHFHSDYDYFECHEQLEDYWKEHANTQRDSIWVGLIQVAVALYHQRRENFVGAYKLMKKALVQFNGKMNETEQLGIDHSSWVKLLNERLVEMKNYIEYTPLWIPFNNQQIVAICQAACSRLNLIWKSNVNPSYKIIHFHKLRDRSDVIKARAHALAERKVLL
ncbi:putative metal-dependent hydrolase [Oikeobacillus pervagus]|uniref:Metal-dependent hydrolase n=1 Tax=Oikeobacillus pervagus TaxID=1325931 RepID=A0AAJ1SYM8_9BACI|nr:DUF309 domain-containing protein [Oikeobacillus pervagus]MDQ0213746.1 putative metal-dependent hydrolase [Oikeobacillus pervagus]